MLNLLIFIAISCLAAERSFAAAGNFSQQIREVGPLYAGRSFIDEYQSCRYRMHGANMWDTLAEIDAAAGNFSQQIREVGPLEIEDHLTQLGLTAPPAYDSRTGIVKLLDLSFCVAVLAHSKDLEIQSATRFVIQSQVHWLLRQWTCSQIFPKAQRVNVGHIRMFQDHKAPYEHAPFDHTHFTLEQSRAANSKMTELTQVFLQALAAPPMEVATQTATALANLVDFTVGCQNAHQQAAKKKKPGAGEL